MARSRDISKVLSSDTDVVLQEELEKPFRNLIINGAMQVAQRGTSVASITSSGYYTTDRFLFAPSSMGTWTMSQENDAPTGSGFRKSTKVLCTTADASPAASDFLLIDHRLEGQNLQSIKKGTAAAEQLTLSFWVKANVTGTYIIELRDSDNTRIVCKSYSVSTSATWEYKTITFPADTTGVLDNDNQASFNVIFWLGAGSDFTSGTLGATWASSVNANRAVGQTNLASATNNYWQITGVQLEVGDTATPFEFKPFNVELEQCYRYFEKTYPHDVAIGSDNTGCAIVNGGPDQVSITYWMCPWRYLVEKRANPTVTIYAMNGTAGSVTKWSSGTTSVTNSGLNTNWQSSTRQVIVLYNQSGTSGITYNAIANAEL